MNEYSFSKHRKFQGGFIISTKGKTNGKYERILEAAVTVFARQGFYQSTVSQIAKEAGVADGTIYLYFKNKDDILVQFFNFKAKQVFASFRQEVDKAADSTEKLRSLVRRHLEEFQRDGDMAVVYQALAYQNIEPIRDQIKEVSKMYLDMVEEILEKGQEEGTMRKDLYISLVKRFILGAVDSAINNWLRSGRKYDLASMTEPLLDLFIRGIGNR